MTKITEEAMDAYAKALKGRSVRRHDVSDSFTVISRVTYDDNGKPKSTKRLETVTHG